MIYFPYIGLVGAGMAIIGARIRYNINKRRFNRRTITGRAWYPSYWTAVKTRTSEWVDRFFANLLILFGFLFIVAWYLHKT